MWEPSIGAAGTAQPVPADVKTSEHHATATDGARIAPGMAARGAGQIVNAELARNNIHVHAPCPDVVAPGSTSARGWRGFPELVPADTDPVLAGKALRPGYLTTAPNSRTFF
ncbi:hypothetical protein [Streptomyces sp. NPDC005303]|uniref:hypothetical protein n=1 Tax=Streptomyces sp. NPDC005303 TaxID=3155713 RepID=UPI0033AD038F